MMEGVVIQVTIGVSHLPVYGCFDFSIRTSHDEDVQEGDLLFFFFLNREDDIRMESIQMI